MASPSRVRVTPFLALTRYLGNIRGFDRTIKLFLAVTTFRGLVIAVLQIVFNLYLYSLGYDARFIGLINGVNSIATLVVSVALGYLSDRLGRRPILLIGGIGYPFVILGLSLAHSTPVLLLFNALFGAFAAAYWVAGMPLLYANTSEEQRVQAFSVNSFLLWGLGPFGALLSGQVVEVAARVMGVSASSSAALRVGMFLMVALAALGAIPYPFLREPSPGVRSREQAPPWRDVTKLFAQLLTPDALIAFGGGAILTFIQLYFHLRFHLDPGPIGLIIGATGVVAGIGTLSTPLVAARWGNLPTVVRFQWMAVPTMCLLAFAHLLPLAILAYCAVLTLRGMIDPVYNAFIQERVPEAYRGRLTGLYSVTYSIGYSLGPAASGVIQKAHGFTPAFVMGAVCYCSGATMLYLFFGRGRRAADPAEEAVVAEEPVSLEARRAERASGR